MKLPHAAQKFIILGLTLLAFLLRAYRLDAQSYWIDEAWTIHFVNMPLSRLVHLLQTEEIHPPFYFPSINVWGHWLGTSEYALRFYSLFFSVLSIPLTYRLGKSLGDDRLGLLAALLMVIAPFQIWHAQEARMYTVLTAASIMSMWGFINLWQGNNGWRWRLLYILATLWTITAHYHGLVIIGIQGLFLLLTWRRHRRGFLAWGATVALILLLYLPWLIYTGTFLRDYRGWLEQPALWDSYARSVIAYSVGKLVPESQAALLTLAFVILYIIGLIYATRRRWGLWRGSEMLFFLLSYTIAPNIAAWLFGELRNTSVYLERYLIPVQVGYLLTISVGILAIADGLPALIRQKNSRDNKDLSLLKWGSMFAATILLLVLIGINAWILNRHYFDPVYAKPDWRGVIRTIENFSLPGDAILLTGDGGEKLFDYYYQGSLPVYYSFNTPAPAPDEAHQLIVQISGAHQRLWYTPYGVDIDPTLESWLAQNTYPAWQSWLGRKRLALYDTQPPANRKEIFNTAFVDSAGQGVSLIEATLSGEPVAAGDVLPVSLIWQANTPLPQDYQVSLRLINSHSDVFAQGDWPPLAASGGTSTWPANQSVTDRRGLWLSPDIPPGTYQLQIVVYHPESGQTLGQPLVIPDIEAAPAQIIPPLEALAIPNFNPIPPPQNLRLVGYAAPSEIQPGQEMWLWLYWQAQKPPARDTILHITLHGDKDSFTTDYPLADTLGSPEKWQMGQVRRAVYHIPTNPRLTGETAALSVSTVSHGSEIEIPVTKINLITRSRQFEPPTAVSPVNTNFGDPPSITLLGYDLNPESLTLNSEPKTLNLNLYWHALNEMDTNYTVFAQLLDNAGQVVAQIDSQPLAGSAPTTTWLPGEYLTDPYALVLPADLPPGKYSLITGLYNAAAGQRLPATSGSGTASGSGDFVELQRITVQ